MKKMVLIENKKAEIAKAEVFNTYGSLNTWLTYFNTNMGKQDLGISDIDPMLLYEVFRENVNRLVSVLEVFEED